MTSRTYPCEGIVNRSTDAHGEVSQERPSASQDISEILSTLDSQLKTLYTALPKRTALVIFTGHSDPIRMADLNARKNAFEIALKFAKTNEELPKWSTADARELEEEVVKAKRGLLFLGVKTG